MVGVDTCPDREAIELTSDPAGIHSDWEKVLAVNQQEQCSVVRERKRRGGPLVFGSWNLTLPTPQFSRRSIATTTESKESEQLSDFISTTELLSCAGRPAGEEPVISSPDGTSEEFFYIGRAERHQGESRRKHSGILQALINSWNEKGIKPPGPGIRTQSFTRISLWLKLKPSPHQHT
ncbi:unnamed protein product [Pleuronectes platessa]|uniref:Uncharacterized protein n=1 Tax=Pleuronectes platessa TaxID=8262 RepID=A0A9N7YLX5_PLEPL|nr:unnamed protein product [Pleuronectes platessa]